MSVNTSCQTLPSTYWSFSEVNLKIPTSGFFAMDEWLPQHVPGWFVQLLHIHLPPLRLKVLHDLFHSSQAFHCLRQLLNTLKSRRKNCRQLRFWYTLWNEKQMEKERWERNVIGLSLWRYQDQTDGPQLLCECRNFPPCDFLHNLVMAANWHF